MNNLKRSLLASSMLVLSAGYGRAQQVTVTNGGSYSLGTTLNVAGTAAITNAPTNAAIVSDTEITVTSSGAITTAGGSGYGIYLGSFTGNTYPSGSLLTDNKITNTGSISTLGDFSTAIYVLSGTSVGPANVTGNTIANVGVIGTSGMSAYGINVVAFSPSSATAVISNSIANTNVISTSGDEATAVRLWATSTTGSASIDGTEVINSGTLETAGADAEGVNLFAFAAAYGSAAISGTILSNTGDIKTSGTESEGVVLRAISSNGDVSLSSNQITNSGTIQTTGSNYSDGIRFLVSASNTGTATIGSSATVNKITNSGTISTTGTSSRGLYLFSMSANDSSSILNNEISNTGTIVTTGQGSQGVFLFSGAANDTSRISGNRIENAGTLSTTGDVADGIALQSLAERGEAAVVDDNTIINAQLMTTSGSHSDGITLIAYSKIALSENNTFVRGNDIVNSGTMLMSGANVTAVYMLSSTRNGQVAEVSGNTITNSGELTLTGSNAAAVVLVAANERVGGLATVADNRLTNTGESEVTSDDSFSIAAVADSDYGNASVIGNVISNAGKVSTQGRNTNGILLFAQSGVGGDYTSSISGNEIANSGEVVTKGSRASAVLIGGTAYGTLSISDNTITNSGSMTALGTGSAAIGIASLAYASAVSVTANTISNTGSLISAYGSAIDISSGNGNTLNLSTDGFIGGVLALGRGDTVNLVSTNAQSKFWTFTENDGCGSGIAAQICAPSFDAANSGTATFNTSGKMPWFHASGGGFTTYATFDASGVAARGNALADMAWMNSGFMQQGLSSLQASSSTSRVWAAAGDNHQDYEGSASVPDEKVNVAGGAFGAATRLKPNTIGGIMVAYNDAKVTLKGLDTESYDNTASSFGGGVFLRHSQSGFDVDAGINLGWTHNKVKRFVNDNLADNGYASGGTAATGAATLGESWNKGDYHAFWVSPELGLAYDLALGDVAILTPSARLRYAMESALSYTEDTDTDRVANTDVSSAAKVGDYTTGVFQADLALEVSKAFDWGQAGISGGYVLRQMTGSDEVQVTMLDQTLDVPVNTTDFYAPYLAANLRWAINEQFDFTIDGRTVFSDSNVGYDIKATLGGTF